MAKLNQMIARKDTSRWGCPRYPQTGENLAGLCTCLPLAGADAAQGPDIPRHLSRFEGLLDVPLAGPTGYVGPFLDAGSPFVAALEPLVRVLWVFQWESHSMKRKDVAPFPDNDKRDIGYRATKAGLGVIPFVGGALQEILEMAVGLPSEKRRVAWFKALAVALHDLNSSVEKLTPQALGQNEEFVSVVAKATDIALRNHEAEKLEALRNIVINTASGLSIDVVLRNTFLDLVDRFSPLHIAALKLYDRPASSPKMEFATKSTWLGGFRKFIVVALPKCADAVLIQVENDLISAGLIHKDSIAAETAQGLMKSHTTERGKAFVRFISKRERT